MSEPFLGQIILFGGNFAPRGWALCNGQILSIAQNTALFSILGTTYGGNGQTTFALPDLRGRVPVHPGQGPGLSSYNLGEVTGAESVTLTKDQMPRHRHGVFGSNDPDATRFRPNGKILGKTKPEAPVYSDQVPDGSIVMHPGMIENTGGDQPHSNIQPVLGVNFIIALEGIFPSRN